MELVIEIGGRHNRMSELVRSHREELTLGRAYDNDVVLKDPYIGARQLYFYKKEDLWFLQVLDNTNPVLINGQPVSENSVVINSGDQLTVGRSNLSLYSSDQAVEPARKLWLASWLHKNSIGVFTLILILAAVCLFDGFYEYIQYSKTHEWKEYVIDALVGGLAIVIWSACWALVGRLIRHQPHFNQHLLASTAVFAGSIIVYPLVDYLEYWSGSLVLSEIANYLIALIVLIFLLKFNLFFSTNIRKTTSVSVIVSFLMVGFIYGITLFERNDFEHYPVYSQVLKPPFAHFATNVSPENFLAELDKKMASIDISDDD